ncbi:hypothetical protein [Streptomyces sp. NPDC001851]|uniref:hypothetical protein n=1 Tax=Streptomyces sp. NPDC001851 TaxID=3154529 RepID=UPI00332AF571
MPAPVRYRSTAAVYDDGGAVRGTTGTTRARGSPDSPLPPESGHWFHRHARPAPYVLPQ